MGRRVFAQHPRTPAETEHVLPLPPDPLHSLFELLMRRDPGDADLAPAPTLHQLSARQLRNVVALARRSRPVAVLYLTTLVPHAAHPDAAAYVEHLATGTAWPAT